MEAPLTETVQSAVATREAIEKLFQERQARLENELAVARSGNYKLPVENLGGVWTPYCAGKRDNAPEVDTAISRAEASDWLAALRTARP